MNEVQRLGGMSRKMNENERTDFEGQVAIVSGGAAGIGEGVVRALSQRGANVVIADKDNQAAGALVKAIGSSRVSSVEVDIAQAEQVSAAVEGVLGQFQKIDILVNCAGWNAFMNPTDYTVEYWQRVRSINLDGTWYFSQAVAVPMRERRRGKIVNFGSSAGILANPHQAPYCVAKHGIVGITRAMAVDLGSYQINVNCVSPTTVETPLGLRSTTPEFRAKMAEQIPLGRLGKVSDMVDAVLFLASPQADFITGVTLPVDGGLTSCRRAQHWGD